MDWGHLQTRISARLFERLRPINLDVVRVVFIGQLPYQEPLDTGLAFAVPEWCHGWPPELRNINIEMRRDIGQTLPDGTLQHWLDQGVLPLVFSKESAAVLECLPAVKVVVAVGAKGRHMARRYAPVGATIMTMVSPSASSAPKGFNRCKIFSRINIVLKTDPIKWGNRV